MWPHSFTWRVWQVNLHVALKLPCHFPHRLACFILTHKLSIVTKTQEKGFKLVTRWYRCPPILRYYNSTTFFFVDLKGPGIMDRRAILGDAHEFTLQGKSLFPEHPYGWARTPNVEYGAFSKGVTAPGPLAPQRRMSLDISMQQLGQSFPATGNQRLYPALGNRQPNSTL